MKRISKDYPEAELIIAALDQREEEAKQIIKMMGMEDRRRLQEAVMHISYWISQINSSDILQTSNNEQAELLK